jgi:hypothetical protein
VGLSRAVVGVLA